MLRLPDGLRGELKAAAEANGRSLNAEIVGRIQGTMGVRDRFAAQALVGLIPFMGIPEDGPDELWDADTAKRAYALADAMMEARK